MGEPMGSSFFVYLSYCFDCQYLDSPFVSTLPVVSFVIRTPLPHFPIFSGQKLSLDQLVHTLYPLQKYLLRLKPLQNRTMP